MGLVAGAMGIALAAQDLPHAFPRDGAVAILDNARVTAWDVTWYKGRPSPMHRHCCDMVGVYLVGSPIRVTNPDGTHRDSTVEPGFILFQRAGVTHKEEGMAEVPRHAVLIDLKGEPVGALPNTSGRPAAFPRPGARLAVDNEKVAIWEYAWTAGDGGGLHFHDKDSIVVFMGDGELRSTLADGTVETIRATRGQVRFSPAGRVHREELVGGAPRAVITELK